MLLWYSNSPCRIKYDTFREKTVHLYFGNFRGFWLGTCNIYPGCPANNIWELTIKIYIFPTKKLRIGHGDPTQNWIMRRTTVTEFSKTFLVFYKWLNLTDVQVIVHSKVCLVIFVCCEHASWYFYHFLVLQVNSILRILNLAIFFYRAEPG
jgi:hypothetical protein